MASTQKLTLNQVNKVTQVQPAPLLKKAHQVERIFSKDFCFLMIVSFLTGIAMTTQMGTLPLFVSYLGGSKGQAGIVVGMLGISSLIFRLPVGPLLDRFGRKLVLIIGMIVMLIDFACLNYFQTVSLLIILRFVQGAGLAFSSTAITTMASDLIPSSRMAVGMSYFTISSTIAAALGPMLGLFLIMRYGFTAMFFVAVILTLLAIGLGLMIPDYYQAQLKAQPKAKADTVTERATVLKAPIVIPSLIIFMACLSYSGVATFYSQFALERHVNNIGYSFAIGSVAIILARIVYSRFLVAVKDSILLAGSILLMVASFSITAESHTLFQFLIASALLGFGFSLIMPILTAVVLKRVSPYQRGNALAVFTGATDIAVGAGAMVWGYVAGLVGFSLTFLACAAFVALALMIIFKYRQSLFE
ncbi:MAG: MFS transporter [Streptococcaceae bacterium]|jgi:MFS family permease|nr:MFS transporter [Streptococcaceae bacterium]